MKKQQNRSQCSKSIPNLNTFFRLFAIPCESVCCAADARQDQQKSYSGPNQLPAEQGHMLVIQPS